VCGIAGVAAPGLSGSADLEPALRALEHRGPDGKGEQRWSGPNASWALGHTRLAINDLSAAGAQPMTNEDSSLVMTFNGEIYNSPELRRYCEAQGHTFRSRCDAEVILHLWEMEGPASLRRLNGIYAFAIASAVSGEVFLARDPFGVKPLVFAENQGALWFASELRALGALGAPMGTDDVTALAQFLTFLWIPDPATPYSGARALEPGSVLRWHEGESQMWSFDDVLSVDQRDLSLREASEEAEGIVRSAVQRQLLSDVPVGLMASGGVDSSLIWWAAAGALGRAFTIDWSGDVGAEQIAEDTTAVRGLECRFGTPTDYLPGPTVDVDELPSSGDLFADPAYHLARVIAREARERGFKVLLSGQGADELFGGYRRHLFAPFLEHLGLGRAGTFGAALLTRGLGNRLGGEYAARVLRATAQPDAFSRYMELCSYSTPPERARALDCTEQEVSDAVVWARHREVYDGLPASWSVLRRALALDLAVYLPGLGLAYCDRAGMEFGVEIRVPWLDLELARWSLALPDRCLVRGRQNKRATRALAESVLGRGIARRPKRGFGVPARQLDAQAAAEVGDRGFRQGQYFTHARRLLATHLAQPSVTDR